MATVLGARLSARAICRSLAPPCFRRRISRTRRIDTLSAGIGPPARHCRDEQKAEHCPAVERLTPLRGGRPQIGVAEIKSESVADFIPESVADFVRNTQGVDGQDFAGIEAYGVERWLAELALALREETYRPEPIRRVFIPKANGKLRPLGISTVRDRVCMTAAMLALEPIFEADLP